MALDENNNFVLALAASELSLGDLSAAHIRLGNPDAPGDVIVDLSPAEFFDMDGLGLGRLISEEPFPTSFVDELLNGDTFIQLQTSAGNLNSVLQPIPEPSEWMLWLSAAGFMAAWSRYRRHLKQ
jgi:hypothetical protein